MLIFVIVFSFKCFAITEYEAEQCIRRYYSYIQQYADDVTKTVELTKKIQSLFIDSNGSVYNDIFTVLDNNPDTDGDVLSYLSSIDKYRKDNLLFVIDKVQVTINPDNTAHLEYRKQFGGEMFVFFLYEEAIIKNGKIVCIYKKGTGKHKNYTDLDVKINSVLIAGADANGKIITEYGAILEKKEIAKIYVKVDYDVDKNTNVVFKITSSTKQYTFTRELSANNNIHSLLWGWNSMSIGDYMSGNCKLELLNSSNEKVLYTKTFTIRNTQTTTNLSVSNSELYFDASGGTKTITVTSNKNWEISVYPYSWVHLTREGNTLTLRLDKNTENRERTDFFKLKADDKEVIINITQKGAYISAEIDSVWVDHNITRTGYNSVYDYYSGWKQVPYTYYVMRIHVDFVIYGMKGEKIRVCAFFYDENGNPMSTSASNSEYRTPDGQVTVQSTNTATYEGSRWNDYVLEIPYNIMEKGSNKFYIQIQDANGNSLITSDYKYFIVN